MATNQITDLELSGIIAAVTNLFLAVKQTAESIKDLASKATTGVQELLRTEIQIDRESESVVKKSYVDLCEMIKEADQYLGRVEIFFSNGQRAREAHESVSDMDYDHLRAMIENLQGSLLEIQSVYESFNSAYRNAQSSTLEAELFCKRRKEENSRQREIVAQVGTAAVVGTTAFASVVTGGLVIPAIAAAATTLVTCRLYESYSQAEQVFRKLSQSFREFEQILNTMYNTVENVHTKLTVLAMIIRDVQTNMRPEVHTAAVEEDTNTNTIMQTLIDAFKWVFRMNTQPSLNSQSDSGPSPETIQKNFVLTASMELLFTKIKEGQEIVAIAKENVAEKERNLERAVRNLR